MCEMMARTCPANTTHSPNAVSLLVHRLRRWPNIETALGECLAFAGWCLKQRYANFKSMFSQHPRRCTTVVPALVLCVRCWLGPGALSSRGTWEWITSTASNEWSETTSKLRVLSLMMKRGHDKTQTTTSIICTRVLRTSKYHNKR